MELVADANVLIDYAKTDPSVLALYIRHIGPIFVPMVILDEVDQLDARDCERLGLTILDGEGKFDVVNQVCPSPFQHACAGRPCG